MDRAVGITKKLRRIGCGKIAGVAGKDGKEKVDRKTGDRKKSVKDYSKRLLNICSR